MSDNKKKRPSFFAHRGEAWVFWISCAGLVFLGMLYLFRYMDGERNFDIVNEMKAQQVLVADRISALEEQNAHYRNEIDSLRTAIDSLRSKMPLTEEIQEP